MTRSTIEFLLLADALALPFWVLVSVVDLQLLPGLPVTGLMFFCPGVAALALAYRRGGVADATKLVRRATVGLFALFVIPAAFEEIGWSAYAVQQLQMRHGALSAGLIVGVAWAAWHWVALLQVHRSLEWIAWWTLWSVSARKASPDN